LQKLAAGLPKPTTDDTTKYFAEHPQLFSARRIFNIQEIVTAPTAGLSEQLRNFATAGKTAEDIAAWLKDKNIKFSGGNASRPAEQIPLELLAKVHALKDGQSLVLESPQSITYLRVASSQSAPVDQATALPRIEQFLTNQRAQDAIAADIKQLRSATTIAYMGEFSKPANAATGAAEPAPEKTAPNTPAAQVDKAQSAIEKGVAGLK
jgi:hypothetical protein